MTLSTNWTEQWHYTASQILGPHSSSWSLRACVGNVFLGTSVKLFSMRMSRLSKLLTCHCITSISHLLCRSILSKSTIVPVNHLLLCLCKTSVNHWLCLCKTSICHLLCLCKTSVNQLLCTCITSISYLLCLCTTSVNQSTDESIYIFNTWSVSPFPQGVPHEWVYIYIYTSCRPLTPLFRVAKVSISFFTG
jgi:hypothetical protein